MITLTKTDLNNKVKMREELKTLIDRFRNVSNYNEEEIFCLILSAIRANEQGVVEVEDLGRRKQYVVDTEKVRTWIEEKLIPNTLQMSMGDEETLKLLIFSLAMPYKMLRGETRATLTEKVRRGKERDFEQIFSDTFVGRIGEVIFKRYAKEKFERDITLDWSISRQIEAFKSDIVGSRKIVSIKSTNTLTSIWAEAPEGADYGIFVKVSLPKDLLMKILAYISSLDKLLNFVKEKIQKDITASDTMDLVNFIRETAYSEQMTVKAFTCGFFEASDSMFRREGNKLPYIGGEFEVYEDKYLVRCDELRSSRQDWENFFNDIAGTST